jgi:hypothetical protein
MKTLRVFDDSKGHGICRSCDAPITWFELVSGKRHPFDGDPVYVQTEHDQATHRLIGQIDQAESHFATCPQAKSWSRK